MRISTLTRTVISNHWFFLLFAICWNENCANHLLNQIIAIVSIGRSDRFQYLMFSLRLFRSIGQIDFLNLFFWFLKEKFVWWFLQYELTASHGFYFRYNKKNLLFIFLGYFCIFSLYFSIQDFKSFTTYSEQPIVL